MNNFKLERTAIYIFFLNKNKLGWGGGEGVRAPEGHRSTEGTSPCSRKCFRREGFRREPLSKTT